MQFDTPLIKGKFIKRYKRFLADIELENGDIITAHCANSGSMMGLKEEGAAVYVSPATNPNRKLKYTWELVKISKNWVGVNTSLPNKIVAEAIEAGKIKPLSGYSQLKQEVKYSSNSRIDILLSDDNKADCYVEVKSVTLSRQPYLAEFPDAVTTRGTKHLHDLSLEVQNGNRAVMIYLVQYENITEFTIAKDIDSTYAQAFYKSVSEGVEAYAYLCKLSPTEITLDKPIIIK